jgi:hypothetical protein
MADNYPVELIMGERVADQTFSDDEKLYIRFDEILGEFVAPTSLICPNQSANRSTFCTDPEWVLLSELPETPDQFKDWGYGYVEVRDIPTPLTPAGALMTEFRPFHDPFPYNYSHTEVRPYRSGGHVRKLKSNVRNLFKITLCRRIIILKRPDLPQPVSQRYLE